MRTWTSTVSPISNLGGSFLILTASAATSRGFFMITTFFRVGGKRLRRASAAQPGLFLAPAGDGAVVAAEQHVGPGHAAEDAWPRVLRIFQPSRVVVRLLGQRGRVAQHAGHVTHHRVDDD